jgi:hypothetical protein
MRIFRRAAAAAVASTLAVGMAGLAVTEPASDLRPAASTRRAAAAQPLIEVDRYVVDFSPNGDHRLDRARIGFTLNRAARVSIAVRNDDGLVRGPVRLGRLPKGRHVWKWTGRTDDGTVAADGIYRVRLKATTSTRTEKAKVYAHVDTVRPQGRLLTTRPTAYPKASMVDDHVQLVWLLDRWNPWDEEFFPEEDQLSRARMEIRTRAGDLVWRRTVRDEYTPTFDWYAQRDGGRALRAGRYVARVMVSDAAGNRRRDSQDLAVSHAQLAEAVWTATVAAARAGRYTPYFGGCNGCGDSCSPVASDRFPDGLSFRPCADPFSWGTVGYFGSDVPFPEAPVDSYRVTATGGPTTPGSSDQGRLSGTTIGPGDSSATTPWTAVDLTGQPFLPALDRPVTWSFATSPPNSYDVASFTVEYKHYVPAT